MTTAETCDHVVRLDARIDKIEESVAAGVVSAIKELASDKEFMSNFGKNLYEQFINHGTNGASQWIGKRLLTALVLALTTAGFLWLARTGGIK